MPTPLPGRPAIRYGLIFGAIIACLGIVNTLVQWWTGAYSTSAQTTNGFTTEHVPDTGASSLLGCIIFLATLGLPFGAGALAAKRTGRASTGAIAGLIAGLIGALIGGAVGFAIIVTLVAPDVQPPAGSGYTPAQIQALLIGTTLAGAFLGLLLDVGYGAGMGALGGLVGANSYRKSQSMGAAPFYPGMPGQPSMPFQPWPYFWSRKG